MQKIRKLLAATDFSEPARDAVVRAAYLAKQTDAQLDLMHVINSSSLTELRKLLGLTDEVDSTLEDDSRAMLLELCKSIEHQTGLAPAPQLRTGLVEEEVMKAAEQSDMLVLGARGQSPLREVFLGTTAEKLLRKSSRPVLINKAPAEGPYKRVMVTMDLVSGSGATLEMAMQIAPDAKISVVHVFDLPFEGKLWLAGVSESDIQRYRNQATQQAHEKICTIAASACGPTVMLNPIIKNGDAARVILEQHEGLAPDLIIVGRRNRLAIGEMLLGSVTRHILSYARCDVLIVQE